MPNDEHAQTTWYVRTAEEIVACYDDGPQARRVARALNDADPALDVALFEVRRHDFENELDDKPVAPCLTPDAICVEVGDTIQLTPHGFDESALVCRYDRNLLRAIDGRTLAFTAEHEGDARVMVNDDSHRALARVAIRAVANGEPATWGDWDNPPAYGVRVERWRARDFE